MKTRIEIEEYYDGFSIHVYDKDNRLTFELELDQEDDLQSLTDLFEHLGFETKYEVVC